MREIPDFGTERASPRGASFGDGGPADIADAGIAETGCMVRRMPSGTDLYRNAVNALKAERSPTCCPLRPAKLRGLGGYVVGLAWITSSVPVVHAWARFGPL